MGKLAVASILLALSVLAGACGGAKKITPGEPTDAAPSDGMVVDGIFFPPANGTWETIDPASAGFDPTKLAALNQFVESSASYTFMILYNGRIVTEQYWQKASAADVGDVESVQKSVTSLLTGIAVSADQLGLDDTVTSHVGAGWSQASPSPEAAITVRNLLTMTTGLDANFGYAAAPGSAWAYNTNVYHELHPVLQAATGQLLSDYSRAVLFDPIGVNGSFWSGTTNLDQTLKMNPRDMSRIGLLMMTGGVWGATQVVPAEYLAEAFNTSQQLNPSYGYLFWLNGKASALLPPSKPSAGELVPHGPADLVMALGAADQKIYASPSKHLVVVRQGKTATSTQTNALSTWDDALWQQIDEAMQ